MIKFCSIFFLLLLTSNAYAKNLRKMKSSEKIVGTDGREQTAYSDGEIKQVEADLENISTSSDIPSTTLPPVQSSSEISIPDLTEITHLSELPEPYFTSAQNILDSQIFDIFLTLTHLILFNLSPKDIETSSYFP